MIKTQNEVIDSASEAAAGIKLERALCFTAAMYAFRHASELAPTEELRDRYRVDAERCDYKARQEGEETPEDVARVMELPIRSKELLHRLRARPLPPRGEPFMSPKLVALQCHGSPVCAAVAKLASLEPETQAAWDVAREIGLESPAHVVDIAREERLEITENLLRFDHDDDQRRIDFAKGFDFKHQSQSRLHRGTRELEILLAEEEVPVAQLRRERAIARSAHEVAFHTDAPEPRDPEAFALYR